MTDDQQPDRPATGPRPDRPAPGDRQPDRPARPDPHPAAPPDQDLDAPLDPYAPLSADGPTVRLASAMAVPGPAGDGGSPAYPDAPAESGSEPADEPVAAGDEPTVVSLPAGRDDEPTTSLAPPSASAEADDEPVRRVDESRSLAGGATKRLQPPFFAPDTTRTRRPAPTPDSPDVRQDPPADAVPADGSAWTTAAPDEAAGREHAGSAGEDGPRHGGPARATDDGPERLAPGRGPDGPAREAAAPSRADAREQVADTGESRSGAPVVSPDEVTASGADGTAGVPETAVPEKPAARRRLSSAGALIWVLLALLGFTLVVQLRSNDDDGGLAGARQEDLVGILSDLEARDQRLQQEINALEESQRQLTSGVAGREAALAEAGKRADELGLLSGTLPARGPGLRISIDPKGQPIKASALLNAVQELRGAGGEVMEIIGDNGVAVRIVASSYFVDAAGGLVIVDGKELSGPYTLWVIGVPSTMQTALQIPGGVVASVSQAGGNVTMEQRSTVEVTAVRQPTSLQYARPVS